MLSLGFSDQLEKIRKNLNPNVVAGLFSATDPPGVKEMSRVWSSNPTVIRGEKARQHASNGLSDGGCTASDDAEANNRISDNVVQVVHVCADHKKMSKLLKHLNNVEKMYKEQNQRHKPRIVVFCNRIKTVRQVAKELREQHAKKVAEIHGDRSQEEREAAVRDFKGGKFNILVASDVAARGLHVKNLSYVVNYDFPSNLETYVHRVGRTGRVDDEGHAFSFLTRRLAPLAAPLIQLLESHKQAVDPNLVKLAESYKIIQEKLKEEPGPKDGVDPANTKKSKKANDHNDHNDSRSQRSQQYHH
jgi:superfamily II DNA/RNA helicase